MSVTDGQAVTAAVTNAAFISRTVNTSAAGIVTLQNTTQATDKDTGALVVEGGVGIEKDVYIGGSLNVAGGIVLSNTPQWYKYSFAHTALQAASTAANFTVFSLPAKGVIHEIDIRPTVQFAGTGITDYKISIGITGDLEKFTSLFDVDQAIVSDLGLHTVCGAVVDYVSATSVKISAVSVGANLNQSTAGNVDVNILWSVMT